VEKVTKLTGSDESVAILDQIAYRFTKLQESLGKLIRLYLWLKGEDVENLPMVDVINLADRYGLGATEKWWFRLRTLRNSIVHEYEENTIWKLAYLDRLNTSLQ